MKQNYPANGSNQSVGSNKYQLYSGAYGGFDSGVRTHFYRSVILAVSGSLFCVAAGEHAAAQSAGAMAVPQASGQAVGETALQTSPPAAFGGYNMTEQVQWPSRPLEPASSPIYSSGSSTTTPVESSSVNASNAPAVSAPPVAGTDTTPTLTLPGLPITQPTVFKNELSASADFMYGIGTITVPIGYAFRGTGVAGFPVGAVSADRSTIYYGGTLSYSYGRSWYLDVSGEDGRSTGSTSITIPGLAGGSFPASFDINDTWYQIYLRFNLQNFLAGTRFRAYLRGGASLVKATLNTVNSPFGAGLGFGAGDFYSEHDDTFDALGNIGFGLTYSIYSTVRLKVGLQLEGEGFAGNRSQDITETFVPSAGGLTRSTTIDNTVYGAIGRLTLHADYRLGQSGRWKLTGDVGMVTKNSWVSYPDTGTKDETLYGPYTKVGASFVF
jgi:hypothetical protein